MRPTWKGAWLAAALLAVAVTGCNRNKGVEASADPQAADPSAALVEERDEGKLEWNVTPEGQVSVRVTVNDGSTPALTGSLLLDGQSYPMTAAGPSLSASIPKLAADLTTIAYSLKVGDATWDGSLHVPQGGTRELVAVPSVTIPEGAKGPHGGVLDVVGDQRVEMVVDPQTNEVRVYLLDDKLQPIPVGSASAFAGILQAPDAPAAAEPKAPAPAQGK